MENDDKASEKSNFFFYLKVKTSCLKRNYDSGIQFRIINQFKINVTNIIKNIKLLV